MIVQSSLETHQQLWHKQHFFSSPCLTPSRFFQQACISRAANLSYFSLLPQPEFIHFLITLSLSLSDPLLPSPIPPHLFTCCHMLVPAQCLHPPLSQLLLPAFCTFPLPSIPSPCIHSCPIALSAALLPPTSSLSPCIILSCPCLHLTSLAFMQQMCDAANVKLE